jgi:hypothetical protein
VKRFDFQHELDEPPTEVLRKVVSEWTEPVASYGYALTSQTDVAVTYHRKYRPWYVIVGAILFFPIGLLFLLITESATISATVEARDGGTLLIISGSGPKRLREGLSTLRREVGGG